MTFRTVLDWRIGDLKSTIPEYLELHLSCYHRNREDNLQHSILQFLPQFTPLEGSLFDQCFLPVWLYLGLARDVEEVDDVWAESVVGNAEPRVVGKRMAGHAASACHCLEARGLRSAGWLRSDR